MFALTKHRVGQIMCTSESDIEVILQYFDSFQLSI